MNLLKARKAKKAKKPHFYRQEWFRMGNQRKKWRKWRKPRGNQSKMRMHKASRGGRVQAGYGSPAAVRGLHPSGAREIIIHNVQQLGIAGKDFAVSIAHGVGGKKRAEIMKAAGEMKLKVLNPFTAKVKEKKVEVKPAEKKVEMKKPEARTEMKPETKPEAKK